MASVQSSAAWFPFCPPHRPDFGSGGSVESNRLRATCERWVQVRFLARLFGRLASPCSDGVEPQRPKPAVRRALVEWQDDSGGKASQRALLKSDRDGRPRLLVRQPLPVSSARIHEKGFEYPVEILSTVPVDGGFELRLEYLGEGRRREERARTNGQALLEGDGSKPMQADVVSMSRLEACNSWQLSRL